MSLTFVQMQNLVLADGFTEVDRSSAKVWLNARHAWLYDADEWSWRIDAAFVTFVAGSQVVGSMPPDFRIATSLYNAQGSRLQAIKDVDEFYLHYNVNLGLTGSPEAFTVVGQNILLGPMGDGTQGILSYERERSALVNDTDVTGLPDGYDLALVHGAKAEGFKLKKIPLWQDHEDEFAASVAALQRNYLTGLRGDVGQFGAYRPGSPAW